MTLYTNDYLEYYLTLVGWLINNGLWGMIEDTGLFAVPFAVIVLREWLKVRGEGADEGNKGVLSLARIETNVYVGYIVVTLCGVPVIHVGFDTLAFDQSRASQCQYQLPEPQNTGWAASFSTLAGKSAQMPVWWGFMHAFSKATTSGAVAAIPCGTDLRQMRMDVNNARINNPLLAQEVADFTRDCYGSSRARLFMRQPNLGSVASQTETLRDLGWIGSKFFLNTAGYYDTDYSRSPRTPWPYDSTRDAGLPQVTGGGGYPTCKQWWADGVIGLKDRVQAQVDPDLMTQFLGWAKWISTDEVKEAVIREVVSPRQQVGGNVYTDYGGDIGAAYLQNDAFVWAPTSRVLIRSAGYIGVGVGSAAYFPAMDIVRQALPMVMAFLKMALVICIPLILIVGAFQLQTAMTVTVVFFALMFVDFWFQLARWLDSTILNTLYGSGSPYKNLDPLLGTLNTAQDVVLNYVMGAMFIIMPLFWVTALGWAGVKAGDVLSGLAGGTKKAQEAGSKGADHIVSGAKIAAKGSPK